MFYPAVPTGTFPNCLKGQAAGSIDGNFSTAMLLVLIFLATFVPQRKQSSMKQRKIQCNGW